MKIDFDYKVKNQNVDRASTAQGGSQVSRNDRTGVIALDISGIVMDNKAYGGQGKTAEDVMQEAETSNIALQRDYMTVMSNCMSTEDFAKLQEEGFHPGDTEIETVVTVVDKIKAELARAGIIISGYTDDLSMDKLTEITGSEALAREISDALNKNDLPAGSENIKSVKLALEKAEHITELTDGVKKYMVQNLMEPTIDNVYAAQFSSPADGSRQGRGYYADDMQGYYAKKADSFNWEQLRPQMEKVIKESGKEVNKETISDARWLVEAGVPLTKESLSCLEKLKDIMLSEDESGYINTIARAMGEGRRAGETSLIPAESLYTQAKALLEDTDGISDEAIDSTVQEGKPLNLKNLTEAQKKLEAVIAGNITEPAESSSEKKQPVQISAVTARRQLEEIRLIMTLEANAKLLKSGFRIDTAPIEEVLEALKAVEEEQNAILFKEDNSSAAREKAMLYAETLTKANDIASMPAAVIGKAVSEGKPFTLNYIHRQGEILQKTYEAAGDTYEALMTAPRKDLGDSIKKAFRNVDALLDGLDLEHTDIDRRAVRILGYNGMEVTTENVAMVKAADEDLQRILGRMTPASVLRMIRDGYNPLETDMEELGDYLTSIESGTGIEAEKYSKYLYKLEQNNQITQEEKESYIGIFRLMRQVEKSDGAVIGSLLKQDAPISFKNLLSALRTQKKKGMDVAVDGKTGGILALDANKDSISGQIESAYRQRYQENLVKDVIDTAEPSVLAKLQLNEDMTVEKLAEQLKENIRWRDKEAENNFRREKMDDISRIKNMEDYVLKALVDFDQPVTVDNLLAADYLSNFRGYTYKNLFAKAGGDQTKKLEAAVNRLQESFTDEETAQKAYAELKETAEQSVNQYLEKAHNSIDVKSMALTFKQISLAANLSKEENYEVPVKIGDEFTSINLRIIRGSGESGKVLATMETQEYGKIAAEITLTRAGASGYIVSDSKEAVEGLKIISTGFSKALTEHGINVKDITNVYSGDLNLNTFQEAGKTAGESKVSSRDLYFVAKQFIYAVQNKKGSE